MLTLRVATLNVWNRSGPWEARFLALRHHLAALAPDVIGLQEVLRAKDVSLGADQATRLAEGLGYHTAYGAAVELGGGIELGNAVLSRFPIARQEVFALPTAEVGEGRSLLFAELAAPFARIPFFTTHLSWRMHEGHVRVEQVRAVAARVNEVAPISAGQGAYPAILVGDLNAEPASDEIRFLCGFTPLGGKSVYFCDTFGRVGTGPGETYARRNPFAAEAWEPDRRIDYVLVRGPDRWGVGDPIEAQVCFETPVNGVFPSDHFGVCATLRVSD